VPMIRVMNWNVEQLSWNKLNPNKRPGMLQAIARTVNAANVDVLVLLEVRITKVMDAMSALSTALGSVAGGNNMAQPNNWQRFFLSYQTGKERYCVFIRNLDLVRPAYPVAGTGPTGTEDDRLNNMQRNVFRLWPTADWNTSAYPAQQPGFRLPLLDLYASSSNPRLAKAQKSAFAGQPIGNGGYSLGRGFRTPALALLAVHGGAGNYLIPVIMCHYASARSRNILASQQVGQLKYLHLAQLFNNNPDNLNAQNQAQPGLSGYIDVLDAANNHTAVRIQELVFTGDFNLDFLTNTMAAAQALIHNAYVQLTPTLRAAGSADAAATAVPGTAVLPAPAVPFGPAPLPPGPVASAIKAQFLKTAVTSQGTIMMPLASPPVPPAGVIPPAPYVTKALDNFFYGGTNLAGAVVNFGPGMIDSGQVVNVPANVVNVPVVNPPDIDLRATSQAYAGAGTKSAQNAPNLRGAGAPPPALTALDRLIGARLVSDHLPVVLQFNCP
jgi:hypothetical protein